MNSFTCGSSRRIWPIKAHPVANVATRNVRQPSSQLQLRHISDRDSWVSPARLRCRRSLKPFKIAHNAMRGGGARAALKCLEDSVCASYPRIRKRRVRERESRSVRNERPNGLKCRRCSRRSRRRRRSSLLNISSSRATAKESMRRLRIFVAICRGD